MERPDAEEALKKPDRQERQTEEAPVEVDAKNELAPETSDATEKGDGWSEEYQILNEYDPVVKDCHDELEALDLQLSNQFREEVVSNRKKATDIRNRLKIKFEKNRKALEAEQKKKKNPYTSDELNEALAEARLLGQNAEEEFARVVEVMGEDIDVDDVIQRLKEKYDVLTPPKDMDAVMEHWGIIKIGKKFRLGGMVQYETVDEAIAFAEKKLNDFLNTGSHSKLEGLLKSIGYNIKTMDNGLFRLTSKDGSSATLMADEFPRYIRGKISPKEINQNLKYLI